MSTILVVDDEEDLLEIVSNHLDETKHRIVTARDGREGLQKAEQVRPHLVILDIAMPHMTGLEMLENLRLMPNFSKTPVIMLTAQGQTTNIFEASRFGVADFLIKPFTREELLKAVQKIL